MPTDDTARALIASLTSRVDTQVAALTKQVAGQAASILTLRNDVDAIKPPPPPTKTTIVVKLGDNIQNALDQAKLDLVKGDVELRIAPQLLNGNAVLRADAINRKAGSVLRIRPDVDASNFKLGSLPWIDATYASAMVKFGSPNYLPALSMEDGAHDIELFGVEAVPNTAWPDRELFTFGRFDATALGMLPWNITLDSCYLHGDAVKGQHKGIALNVKGAKMLRCYFEKFLEVGRDSQAFTVINGTGPFLFDSCYFEAGTENVLFGGDDPRIKDLVPTDATFRNCLFFKPQEWRTLTAPDGKKFQIKNLLELKNAAKVLVEGCMFDGTWSAAQAGDAILLNVRNNEGNAPWSTVGDITIRLCVIKNAPDGAAFQLMGLDDNPVASVQGKNVLLEHNLILGCRNGTIMNSGFQPTIMRHNTFTRAQEWMLKFTNKPIPNGQFEFTSNITPSGQYAIVGDGTGVGKPTLDAMAPGAIFSKNAVEAAPFVTFPTGNYVLPTGTIASRLDARGRYTGTELGVDGVKVGADVDEIIRRMPWAKW